MTSEAEFIEAAKEGGATKIASLLKVDPGLVRAVGDHLKSALHWAAEMDHVDVAAALVEAGADIEARTSWGASPFDWAATMGSSRVADLLLARGATGLTLITAASLGKLSAVRGIIESGEDLSAHRRRDAPTAPDDDHWPPDSAHIRKDAISDALYAAARNGHRDVVAYLLDHGADIDAKGVFGATGLHWAAINGHQEAVEFLLKHGANLTIRDSKFDSTPEGWAQEGGHNSIVAMLRQARPTA
ncbi:MAG: ankyrin repeat domain-containing protein [Pyrinomonadaceae bacterium]|nr:ankyrin repeat domain-containing protein [Pyrinomonadaceae bacterium]